MNAVIEAVATHFMIPPDEVLAGMQGKRGIARMSAIYLAKKLCTSTIAVIASRFGIGTSAVSVGLKRLEERWLKQPDLKAEINEIENELRRRGNSID